MGGPFLSLILQLGGGAKAIDWHLVSIHHLHWDTGGQNGVSIGNQCLYRAGGHTRDGSRCWSWCVSGGVGQSDRGGVCGGRGVAAASQLQ